MNTGLDINGGPCFREYSHPRAHPRILLLASTSTCFFFFSCALSAIRASARDAADTGRRGYLTPAKFGRSLARASPPYITGANGRPRSSRRRISVFVVPPRRRPSFPLPCPRDARLIRRGGTFAFVESRAAVEASDIGRFVTRE